MCCVCSARRAMLRRPRNGHRMCRECFLGVFEAEVHETIVRERLFARGQRVAIAASGGKGANLLTHSFINDPSSD